MTDSNRIQLAAVRETTIGTTPDTPRMRKMRFTGESLAFRPDFIQSNEIRDDRMSADPIKVGESNAGGINFEWHYPKDESILSEAICSAFMADWTKSPQRDNDGTADAVITGVAATSDTYTVTTGAAFVEGHLVRATGFTNSGNNQIFRAQSGSGATSVIAPSSPGLTDEDAPPAAARLKAVGFQGASGDITATASGLVSTSLDFTTLGLAAGMWLKIGGSAAADKFATAANNDWVRVTAVDDTALTCDNLPSGWTADDGTGKTLKVWFGDYIKNGTTKVGLSIERGFMGQGTPTYVLQKGMVVNSMTVTIPKKQVTTGSFDFMGMAGSQGTTSVDSSPDAAPALADYPVVAGSANVGRVAENGATLASPNWADSVTYTLNNNLRAIEAVDSIAPVAHGVGECSVTVELNTYFGSNTLYAKLLSGTATNVNSRVVKNSQAMIWACPRLTATEGNPNAQGKNQDVMLPLRLSASYDSTTAAHIILNRLEYYE